MPHPQTFDARRRTMDPRAWSRRGFLGGAASLAALTLAACSPSGRTREPGYSDYYLAYYGPKPGEKHPLPAVDLRQMKPTHLRAEVDDPTGEAPGTIVVSTSERSAPVSLSLA